MWYDQQMFKIPQGWEVISGGKDDEPRNKTPKQPPRQIHATESVTHWQEVGGNTALKPSVPEKDIA